VVCLRNAGGGWWRKKPGGSDDVRHTSVDPSAGHVDLRSNSRIGLGGSRRFGTSISMNVGGASSTG
ncbi:unnamed protein product, partial [Ectocarpus sp. 12 AP-2014]